MIDIFDPPPQLPPRNVVNQTSSDKPLEQYGIMQQLVKAASAGINGFIDSKEQRILAMEDIQQTNLDSQNQRAISSVIAQSPQFLAQQKWRKAAGWDDDDNDNDN